MPVNPLINSKDFFIDKLGPELKRPQFKGLKARYQLFQLSNGQMVAEFFVKGPKMDWLGFDPQILRHSDDDQPFQMATFLWKVVTRKIHPACYQYLLGPITQRMIKGGERKGFPAMFKAIDGAGETKGAMAKLDDEFNLNLAIDDDVKRVAKKRDFDQQYVEGVLAERPHLLKP